MTAIDGPSGLDETNTSYASGGRQLQARDVRIKPKSTTSFPLCDLLFTAVSLSVYACTIVFDLIILHFLYLNSTGYLLKNYSAHRVAQSNPSRGRLAVVATLPDDNKTLLNNTTSPAATAFESSSSSFYPTSSYDVWLWIVSFVLFVYFLTTQIISLLWYNREFQRSLPARAARKRNLIKPHPYTFLPENEFVPYGNNNLVPATPSFSPASPEVALPIVINGNSINSNPPPAPTPPATSFLKSPPPPVLTPPPTPPDGMSEEDLVVAAYLSSKYYYYDLFRVFLPLLLLHLLQLHVFWRHVRLFLEPSSPISSMVETSGVEENSRPSFCKISTKLRRRYRECEFSRLSVLRLSQGILQGIPMFIIKSYLLLLFYFKPPPAYDHNLRPPPSITGGLPSKLFQSDSASDPWVVPKSPPWWAVYAGIKNDALPPSAAEPSWYQGSGNGGGGGIHSRLSLGLAADPNLFLTSTLFSLCCIAWSFATYDKRMLLLLSYPEGGHRGQEIKLVNRGGEGVKLTWLGITVKFMAEFFTLASRCLLLQLFSLACVAWTSIIVLTHWVFAFAWLYRKPFVFEEEGQNQTLPSSSLSPSAPPSKPLGTAVDKPNLIEFKGKFKTILSRAACLRHDCKMSHRKSTVVVRKMVISFVMAFVYVFCYVDMHCGTPKFRMTTFYLMFFVENTLMVTVWLYRISSPGTNSSYNNYFRLGELKIRLATILVTYSAFFVGLAFLLLFYRFIYQENNNHNNNNSIRGEENPDYYYYPPSCVNGYGRHHRPPSLLIQDGRIPGSNEQKTRSCLGHQIYPDTSCRTGGGSSNLLTTGRSTLSGSRNISNHHHHPKVIYPPPLQGHKSLFHDSRLSRKRQQPQAQQQSLLNTIPEMVPTISTDRQVSRASANQGIHYDCCSRERLKINSNHLRPHNLCSINNNNCCLHHHHKPRRFVSAQLKQPQNITGSSIQSYSNPPFSSGAAGPGISQSLIRRFKRLKNPSRQNHHPPKTKLVKTDNKHLPLIHHHGAANGIGNHNINLRSKGHCVEINSSDKSRHSTRYHQPFPNGFKSNLNGSCRSRYQDQAIITNATDSKNGRIYYVENGSRDDLNRRPILPPPAAPGNDNHRLPPQLVSSDAQNYSDKREKDDTHLRRNHNNNFSSSNTKTSTNPEGGCGNGIVSCYTNQRAAHNNRHHHPPNTLQRSKHEKIEYNNYHYVPVNTRLKYKKINPLEMN